MDNDYSKMSTEELEKLLVEYEDIAGKSFNTQMALKLSICSVYGALGSKGFFVYNPELAKSVTGNGRFYINLLSQRINEHLRNIDGKDHIVYNDTDSVTGDSSIIINNKKINISDYFDSKCKDTSTDKLVIPVTGDVARSLNSDLIVEDKPVKYVMRHKTKKRLFKIKVRNREVTVTEDESLVVLRDGELVRVKPLEIKKTDGIIIDGQS